MRPGSRTDNRSVFSRFFRSSTPFALLLLGGGATLLTPQIAMAAQPTDCPTVLLGQSGNICNSADIQVATAISGLGGDTGACLPGEEYVVNLNGSMQIRKNDRWDIGVFVATDGKDLTQTAANGGAAVCEVAPLPAIDRQRDGADPGEDFVMGTFDGAAGDDQCGDTSGLANGDTISDFPITFGMDPTVYDGPVTLTCVAGPNGKLVLQSLISWNQSDPGQCDPTDPLDYKLDQISKCSVNVTELDVEIVGRVTIRKTAPNGGLNNFGFTYSNTKEPTADTITNPSSPFDLQDGGEVEIFAEIGTGDATIVVDETSLPANWQFASLSCTGDDVTPVTINGSEVTIALSYDSDDPDASQSDVVCTYVNEEIIREVTLDKTTSTADYDDTDDTIDYSYLVTNAGNVALNFPVSVSDDKVTVTCPADDGVDTILDPGESVTCTASYDIGQPDIDAGSVTNTADATVDGVTSETDSVTVNAVQSPAMTVVKSSPTTSIGEPLTVSYSYLVTNTGNVTLTTIALTDDNDDDDLSCPADTLAPTGQMTCTASRAVSQGEIDAGGSLDNNVSATSAEGAQAQSSLSIPITQSPSLSVLKDGTWNDDGSIPGVAEEGETISYNIAVSNNGNVTLASVLVTDPLITDPPNSGTISCNGGNNPITSLAPDANEICTATYTVTAADVTAGSVSNTATAANGDTSDTGSDTVDLPDAPGLSLVKAGVFQDDITGDGFAQAGETIAYTFDVSNTGTTAATQVAVTDPLITDAPNSGTITCPGGNPIPSLAGGATVQCTASYTLLQADVDAGSVYNLATADSVETEATTAEDLVLLTQNVDWTITKSGVFQDESDDGLAQPGETILYTFDVENTGFVTLTNVAVSDPKVSTITCTGGNPIPSIAPAATVQCTGSYAVSQVDIDAGQVGNTGTGDPDESAPQDSSTTTDLPQEAGMTIVKSSATTEVVAPVTVLYSYLVTNTGNITLTGISLDDDNDEDDMSCPATTLAPGDDMTCSASHEVIQDEIDANGSPTADTGLLQNTVTGTATELTEDASASLDITITQSPGAEVQKSSVTTEVTAEGAVTYDYLVTNTGNVTLTGLLLTDDNVDAAVDCGGTDTLPPGEDLACTAVHTVTEQELEDGGSPEAGSGFLSNVVVASSNEAEDATDNLDIEMNYVDGMTIRVTKYFSDNSDGEATVQLTCNSGLPLQQTFKLSDTEHVTFTVQHFIPGETDCRVEELMSSQPGYEPEFLAGAPTGDAADVRSEVDGCYYDGINGGEFTCDITNVTGAVAADVYKVWFVPDEDTGVPQSADITIWCDSEIMGGTLDQASGHYFLAFPGITSDQQLTAMVVPKAPSTSCWAVESGLHAAIAVMNECGDSLETAQLSLTAGNGDECTITNSIYFEGIPVMNRYGLGLLVLLMLGVGMIATRRSGA